MFGGFQPDAFQPDAYQNEADQLISRRRHRRYRKPIWPTLEEIVSAKEKAEQEAQALAQQIALLMEAPQTSKVTAQLKAMNAKLDRLDRYIEDKAEEELMEVLAYLDD